MIKKNEALDFSQASLSSIEVAVTEENWALEPSLKKLEVLEALLKKSHDGQKRDVYNLCEMWFENTTLAKEYAKSMEEGHSIAHDSFKNYL